MFNSRKVYVALIPKGFWKLSPQRCYRLRFGFMVFNVTFNNISVISWRLVLLMEETGVPGKNHRPALCHWQTLSHNVSSTPGLSGICTHTDCIGSCTYNYHTIMTTRVPQRFFMFPAHIHAIGFSSKHRSFKFPPSQIYFMLTYHRNVSNWSIIYILGCILPDMFYIATSQTTLRLLHHKQNLGCHTIIIL